MPQPRSVSNSESAVLKRFSPMWDMHLDTAGYSGRSTKKFAFSYMESIRKTSSESHFQVPVAMDSIEVKLYSWRAYAL
jgi:hypothetical protein